ncbi:hypothetical protein FISHEDRAFT_9040, partial [Fistulina hepatica ATCC 64428]
DGLYGTADHLVSADFPFVFISNFSDSPIHIAGDSLIGRAHNPRSWLNRPDNFSEEDHRRIHVHATLIRTLVDQTPAVCSAIRAETAITSKAQRNAEGPDDPLATAPIKGGPKTSMEADDPVSTSTLLQAVDVPTDLLDDKCATLEQVISQNAQAFGLDGWLGNYEGLVDIPLKPDTQPISLPPFSASPANRKVIDTQ